MVNTNLQKWQRRAQFNHANKNKCRLFSLQKMFKINNGIVGNEKEYHMGWMGKDLV